MDLVRITYAGRKTYRDKPAKTSWNPGDTKPVTIDTARRLKKFAEFQMADDQGSSTAIDGEESAVMAQQNEIDQSDKQERDQVEGVLMTIESMDKGALEAYASKYEVNIDKRKKVEDLRSQVSGLVEQFGAR